VYADDILHSLGAELMPSGVVFEIKSDDRELLRKLLPELRKDIIRLLANHPRLAIAVVSHGMEEVALANKNKKRYADVHELVRNMVAGGDVEFHVSGEVAARNGLVSSDFPDFIQVSNSAPMTIIQLEEHGYVVINRLKAAHEDYKLSSLINQN